MRKTDDDVKETTTDRTDADADTNSRDENDTDELRPAEKIGERPDNLRRRSDWFQKRSGKR